MLSIGAMANGGYYMDPSENIVDYYMRERELPVGRWLGNGADILGLTLDGGGVERTEFLALTQGFAPDGSGTRLVQNAGKERRNGWDLCFSVPKSVSAIGGVGDEIAHHVIRKAKDEALKETCRFIQEEFGLTRRGKGGSVKEEAQLIFAAFDHHTSRRNDPQYHTHLVLLNVCIRSDGTTGSIESKAIYDAKMLIGAYFRAELAYQLEEAGFRIERRGTSFEIEGVPRSLMRAFSKRREEIETELERRGETSAKAASIATLQTRQSKRSEPVDDLRARWRATGEAHSFTEREVRALRQEPITVDQETQRTLLRETMAAARERVIREKGAITERDLLRAALEEAPGRGVWASLARTAVKHELAPNSDSPARQPPDKGEHSANFRVQRETQRNIHRQGEDSHSLHHSIEL